MFVKGAPEVIIPMTLNYSSFEVVENNAIKGLRIISLAYKKLDCSAEQAIDLPRRELEKDLVFLGFALFENELKPQSREVIEKL